jgi:hypothetical protein
MKNVKFGLSVAQQSKGRRPKPYHPIAGDSAGLGYEAGDWCLGRCVGSCIEQAAYS